MVVVRLMMLVLLLLLHTLRALTPDDEDRNLFHPLTSHLPILRPSSSWRPSRLD